VSIGSNVADFGDAGIGLFDGIVPVEVKISDRDKHAAGFRRTKTRLEEFK